MLDFEEDYSNQIKMNQNDELSSRIKYLSFLIYIISFIIYKQSLFNCDNLILNECIEKYNINIVIICFIKCVISGFILSANISFIFWKLLSTLHIVLTILFLMILLILDFGNDIYSHGIINFTIFCISLIFGFLFFFILQIIINSFVRKNYRNAFILITIIIVAIICFFSLYLLLTSCNYWDKGSNEVSIDNNKEKYSCRIVSPNKCYMKFFDEIFDFSKMMDLKCDSTSNKPKFSEILENYTLYYDHVFNDNITVINFPLTNIANYSGDGFNGENNFARKVISNIKGSTEKDLNNSEIFLIKNGNDANIEMSIKKKENLILQRIILSKSSSKIKNIMFIYIDSLSRQQLHRKLSQLSNLFSELLDNSHSNYESFEFFKYHTFESNYAHKSINSMFYGTDKIYEDYKNNEEKKSFHILSHLKKNGYITAQSANICSKHLSSIYYNSFKDEFDHENIAMFCDPSYYINNPKKRNIKGIYSSLQRCLFGKDTYEYVINYGRMFWETYPESNKFLRLGFFDGNEKSGEVIKHLDTYLVNFILELINQGKFYKTALFLVSSKGELESGIYNVDRKSEYFFERNLGSWFILMNKYSIEEKIIQKIRSNSQTFVTPYDVYDTMLSMIYDCYDMDCFQGISHKSNNGNSVFNTINGFERNCGKYKEINENDCHCKNY